MKLISQKLRLEKDRSDVTERDKEYGNSWDYLKMWNYTLRSFKYL